MRYVVCKYSFSSKLFVLTPRRACVEGMRILSKPLRSFQDGKDEMRRIEAHNASGRELDNAMVSALRDGKDLRWHSRDGRMPFFQIPSLIRPGVVFSFSPLSENLANINAASPANAGASHDRATTGEKEK